MLRVLDEAAARRWARESVTALAADRAALDRINVYPVADADTGTNLLHTMRSAGSALDASEAVAPDGLLAVLAEGALAGARGNSGMLFSQVLRGLAEGVRGVGKIDGAAWRDALHRAESLARRAVAEPVEGTLLSVLRAAVLGAANCTSDELADVVRLSTADAVLALERTTAQLPALAAAGVVDAGGRGLVVLLDALHAVVHGGARLAPEPPEGELREPAAPGGPAYEVMYLLTGAEPEGLERLRDALAELGDCASVAGDGADSWAVHVHCDDIGAAIEAGIETGRVRRIRVVRFADQAAAPHAASGQGVLACVRGGELAELFRGEGAGVLEVGAEPPAADELVEAIDATGAAHVVVLPNDAAVTAVAERAAEHLVRAGRDVVVVPTGSPVQGLAALAVHDTSRRRPDDVVAMAEAAAATRRGELRIADSEALTWAGHCRPGDVLGLADGEVVLLGRDFFAVARDLVDRMFTAGGELVTVLIGARAPAGVGDELTAHLARHRPEVECVCYPGGELGSAVLLGVE